MFKFITKVWIAGEINDFRINRKKRKLEEKQLRKERRINNIYEIGMVDEIVKNDKTKKKEWEMIQTKIALASLGFFVSIFASLLLVQLFFLALLDLFYIIILAFKLSKIKKKHLGK